MTIKHVAPQRRPKVDEAAWQSRLRGRLRADVPMKETNWFQVGGHAEFLFKPEDTEDLQTLMREKPASLPVTILGVGSNIIIRDGGIAGVVVRLGRGFTGAEILKQSHMIRAGAAMLDVHVAALAAEHGISGFEFLSGIPGTIGGAVKMNAGAYGCELADVAVSVDVMYQDGTLGTLPASDCGFGYRHSHLPAGAIVLGVLLQGGEDEPATISQRIKEIQQNREATQPIRAKTGGSTFKNPQGHKAWQLIDAAGCRGMRYGDAQVSEKHCNFMINTDRATASDLEILGDKVIEKVLAMSGIKLEWEIKRIGFMD